MTFPNPEDHGRLAVHGENFFFEMGPIRPPSEGSDHSLLIRTTRNCSWNRCEFCATYRGEKFGYRQVEDIKKDIDVARALKEELQAAAGGRGGWITQDVIRGVWGGNPLLYGENSGNLSRKWQNLQNVANWLASGARTVFLRTRMP